MFDPSSVNRRLDLQAEYYKKCRENTFFTYLPVQIIFPRAYKQFLGLKILKFFDAHPESFLLWIRDPGRKNSDPG
jgi:hypothetical protein